MRHVFRPWFGRALTASIGAICLVALAGLMADNGMRDLLRAGPWLAFVAGSCWAMFWRPHVVVDEAGVEMVNVFRTIRLPWPSIQAIDTKWALTLITAYGRYTAWAAPAPSIYGSFRADRSELRHLPRSTYDGGAVRPGDIPSSPSGEAAMVIREHWEYLRDAGYLDDPRLEFDRPPVRWHVGVLGVGVGLLVLAFAGLVI